MALNVLCFFFCFYTRNGQIPEEGVGKTYDVFYSYIFGPFHPEKIPLQILITTPVQTTVLDSQEYKHLCLSRRLNIRLFRIHLTLRLTLGLVTPHAAALSSTDNENLCHVVYSLRC